MNRVPHDPEAERSIVGALILDPSQWPTVSRLVRVTDFYTKAPRDVFDMIGAMVEGGEPLDAVSVAAEMRRADPRFDALVIQDMIESVGVTASAPHHARIVARMATQRRIIMAATDAVEIASVDGQDPEQLIAKAVARMLDAHHTGDSDMTTADVVTMWLDEAERTAWREKIMPTGLPTIDGKLGGGLVPGRLYIVGARPGVGKTGLAGNIALHAVKRGQSVLFVSMEMTASEVMERMVVDNWDVRPTDETGRINAMMHAADSGWPITIRERADLSSVVAAVTDGDYRLLILDYIGLLPTRMDFERRDLEIAHITGTLKRLAKQRELPVLALAQLNRGSMAGAKPRPPRLSDLRESGAQEQDADVVMLLDRDTDKDSFEAKIAVAKNRHGASGVADLQFDPIHTRFRETQRY